MEFERHIFLKKILKQNGFKGTSQTDNSTVMTKCESKFTFSKNGNINMHVVDDELSCIKLAVADNPQIFEFESYLGVDEVGLSDENDTIVVSAVACTKKQATELFFSGVMDSKSGLLKTHPQQGIEPLAKKIDENTIDSETLIKPPEKVKELVDLGWTKKQILASMTHFCLNQVLSRTHVTQVGMDKFDDIHSNAIRDELGKQYPSVNVLCEPKCEQRSIAVAAASIAATQKRLEYIAKNEQHEESSNVPEFEYVHFDSVKEEHYPQIKRILENLEQFYPDILKWFETKIVKSGNDSGRGLVCLVDKNVVGVILTKEEDKQNAKIRNLYILPGYRRHGIGDALMQSEMNHYKRQQISRINCTVAQENRYLLEFFVTYGFGFVGFNPDLYRESASELMLVKQNVYQILDWDHFEIVVLDRLFKKRGHNVTRVSKGVYRITPLVSFLKFQDAFEPIDYCVFFFRDADEFQKSGGFKNVVELSREYEAIPVLIIPYTEEIGRYENVRIIDLFELKRMFSMEYVTDDPGSAIIVPIRGQYANRLFLDVSQARFMLDKTQLRKDNVYYRDAKDFDSFKRGMTLFFYDSDKKRISGRAVLARKEQGEPDYLVRLFGPLGCWSKDDLQEHLQGKTQGMAFQFDFFEPAPKPLTLRRLRTLVPKFNPITIFKIPKNQHISITQACGYTHNND